MKCLPFTKSIYLANQTWNLNDCRISGLLAFLKKICFLALMIIICLKRINEETIFILVERINVCWVPRGFSFHTKFENPKIKMRENIVFLPYQYRSIHSEMPLNNNLNLFKGKNKLTTKERKRESIKSKIKLSS